LENKLSGLERLFKIKLNYRSNFVLQRDNLMRTNAKFNREQVVDKATELYWQKGFNGTSMRNLQEVIDMRPGSIYASFGSKEGLFREALNHYANMGIAGLMECVEKTTSPMHALQLFMQQLVVGSKKKAPSCMCMLAKTVGELTDDNADLLAETKRLLAKIEGEFATLLIKAQEIGEIDKTKDVIKLARHIQVQTLGLRTYARTCDDSALLESMVQDVFRHYPF
jgi:TetR/AcrR family transcriptional repressor of nem operon